MFKKEGFMGNLWLNNELVDRLAMLQQTEIEHFGINEAHIIIRYKKRSNALL